MYERTLVIGLGLIGGSLCLTLRQASLTQKIFGYDINSVTTKRAEKNRIIDQGKSNLKEAIDQVLSDKDLIIIAVPLTSYKEILAACHASNTQATIMDVGSTKAGLLTTLRAIWGQIPPHFVGVHPIAGSEQSGLASASEQLFTNRRVVIIPYKWTEPARVYKLAELWQKLNSNVFFMDWKTHDKIFSYTSHLPHLLSYSLVEALAKHKNNRDFFAYAASGFRDFTRIAASDEQMWADIFLANKENLTIALSRFQSFLASVRKDIQLDRRQNLITRLKESRHRRHEFDNPASLQDDCYYQCASSSALQGEIRVAADKSISHRAIIFGSIAQGTTRVTNYLDAQDTKTSIECFRGMKIQIIREKENLLIKGNGLYGIKKPENSLYCGNSGTTARLLCGLLSPQRWTSHLQGDSSLSKRPMNRVIKPLQRMGARIYSHNQKNLPLLIFGSPKINAVKYTMPIASAQVKSAILLASLYADGETTIIEPVGTRDHTERMMKNFGYGIKTVNNHTIIMQGKKILHAAEVKVPGDISSAAFFIVAASITPDSRILIKDVGVNNRRIGIINILNLMGGDIKLHNKRQYGNEPIADIEVRYAPLKGIDIPPAQVPLAIDELPVIMIAAACAQGTTRLSQAQELRVKESDRIAVMVEGLLRLGIEAQATEDGVIIIGGKLTGGVVDSYEDHRIAMSFAVAACRAAKEVKIERCTNVTTSFPNFIECARTVGMPIEKFSG